MYFDEIDVWALYGLENPDKGVEVTDAAEPSEVPEGVNESESALPTDDVEDIEEQEYDAEAGDEPADASETQNPEPQSKEERAKQAAARRKREQDEAIKAAVDAAVATERAANEQRIKDLIAGMGLKDPNNGNKAIETVEEYTAFQQAQALKNAEAELKRGKLTPEMLQQIVSQMPEMQQARQVLQQAEREKQTAQQQRVQQQVNAEIAEITKLDPTITSLETLLKSENGQKIYELTKKGNSLLDSYKLANLDKLTQRAASAARAQTAASNQSRQHLKPTQARGQGSIEVPAAQAAMFRKLIPGISDAEIRKSYEGYLKDIK